MTAFEELKAHRQPGRETLALLQRLVAQVTRTSTFPPRGGHVAWTDQAVIDHIAKLLLRKNGFGFVIACFLKADDQASLERLLLAAIRNDLIDEAKSQPIGKLRRRMQTLLRQDDRFIDASDLHQGQDAWSLPSSLPVPSQADVGQLLDLSIGIEAAPILSLPRAGRTPKPARESLLTMTYGVLERLNAALRAQTLAHFLGVRFDLIDPPQVAGFDGDRAASEAEAEHAVSDLDAELLAEEFFAELSPLERSIVPILGDSDAIESSFGDAGLEAADTLRDHLRVLVGSDVGRDALGPLLRMCSTEVHA
ncbi:hypothetical protein BOH66_16130 [Microbacterium aurum]|uniref:Uncharacterized protein n=2 Tax=Microbacterium aurum TaxID=36805 RepID=A0A1P8UBT3_9MICO|nr:hypothetical protein BOH66_16130 [Microbacterium aurum]